MQVDLAYRGNGTFAVTDDASYALVNQKFGQGQVIRFSHDEQRSDEEHKFWFAVVRACWKSLPDKARRERWPNAEYLRKWLLVKAGHCRKMDVVCDNSRDIPHIINTARFIDKYSVIKVDRIAGVVSIFIAESQEYKVMGKEKFQAVTTLCLHILAEIMGCSPADILQGRDAPDWIKNTTVVRQ
jgi:hypothetical protein